jgi:hypothetical protein
MSNKKVKRYSGEDGESEVIDLRDDTSQPTGIDDDVRARAMKFLETGKKDDEVEFSEPKKSKKKVETKKETNTTVEKKLEKPSEKKSEKLTSMTKSINPPKTSGMGSLLNAFKSVKDKINEPVEEQARNFRSASSRKEQAANPDKFVAPKYKSGGKVAGKLATRGYGISKHGKSK